MGRGRYDSGSDRYSSPAACDRHHGAVDINNAIPDSFDTFYYTLADKLGIDRIAKYASEFGFGQKTGIDLPGVQPGLMPSAQWAMKDYHRNWYAGETISVGIGQGAVEATPMQLARITGGFPPISARHCWRASPALATLISPSIR
jgi:penicillin-binding protein 2